MNLLFQALVIFTFILPGLIVRSAYFQGGWKYPRGRLGAVADEVPRALIYAAIINLAYYLAVDRLRASGRLSVHPVDLVSTVCWLANNFGNDPRLYRRAVDSLARSPVQLFGYFAGLYAFAFAIGKASHNVVRRLQFDRIFPSCRFDNDWYYLFRGEIRDFGLRDEPRSQKVARAWTRTWHCLRHPIASQANRNREATVIAAIVDVKDASFLYVGILVDFHFTPAGDLDRIVLDETKRRPLSNDDEEKKPDYDPGDLDRYYPVKGRYFTLRYSEIKTLNVDYISAEVVDVAAAEVVEESNDVGPFD